MGTPLSGPYAFNTRQYYDPSGDTGAPIDAEMSWEQLDTTLLFLSGAIAGVPTGIAEVLVGTSASLILSSSGTITGSIQEGTVWVVANDSPSNNGLTYIFDSGLPSPGYGTWYPFNLQVPLPYVRLAATSSAAQIISSSLLISGSGVTFSSSLYWSGSSQAAANSTAYTVVLSSSGQLFVTGAYGGGGGGSTALGFKTDPNASYQLISTDANKVVRLLNSSTITVQVTASNFTSGDQVIVMQSGSGQCSFVAGPGTTIFSANNMLKTRTQYSAATLIFSGSAHCYLFGDIAP